MKAIFKSVSERRIEDFWLHSISTGFFAKAFSIPRDPEQRSPSEKAELDRMHFDQAQLDLLTHLQLSTKFQVPKDQNAFIAGLLHDLGKVVTLLCFEDSLDLLDAIIEEEVAEQKAQGTAYAHSTITIERSLMRDMDHQILGQRIAERWELEHWIQEVIGRHHSYTTDEGKPPSAMVPLMALANLASNMYSCFPYRATQHPLRIMTRKLKKGLGRDKFHDPDAVKKALDDTLMADLRDTLDRMDVPKSLWETVDCRDFFTLAFVLQPQITDATTAFFRQSQ